MLPVPWIGTGTQEATHSPIQAEAKEFSEGLTIWLRGWRWGGAGIHAFQLKAGRILAQLVLPGQWCLGSGQSRATKSHSPSDPAQPSLLTLGDWHRQEVGERPCHPAAPALQ